MKTSEFCLLDCAPCRCTRQLTVSPVQIPHLLLSFLSFSMLTLLYSYLSAQNIYLFLLELFPVLFFFFSFLLLCCLSLQQPQAFFTERLPTRRQLQRSHISFLSWPLHLAPCTEFLGLTTAPYQSAFYSLVKVLSAFSSHYTIDVSVRYGKGPGRCGKGLNKPSQKDNCLTAVQGLKNNSRKHIFKLLQ